MGCAVNGPGEAGDADFGIAGGRDVGFIYAHGRVLKKVESPLLIDELFREIDAWIAEACRARSASRWPSRPRWPWPRRRSSRRVASEANASSRLPGQ